MKNIIAILVVLVLAYFAWNYTQEQKEIEQAKQELGVTEDTQTQDEESPEETGGLLDGGTNQNTQQDNNQEVETKPETFTIKYLNENEFIQLDQLQESDLADGKIEITGKTLTNVDSIRVTFKNSDSTYPDDDYTLGQFSAGDDTFLYRAFSQYQVFDYGTNVYQFIAKSGDQESILELTIYNPEETLEELDNVNAMQIDISKLPTSGEYGNPVKVSESSVSYSDISGLEISAVKDLEFSCDNEYILSQTQRLNLGTIWWNTCRPNADETSISYYILSVVDGKYNYSKHYVTKDYYGILELEQEDISETWDAFETQEQRNNWLKEKNTQLKEKHTEYALVEVTDNLFNEITK